MPGVYHPASVVVMVVVLLLAMICLSVRPSVIESGWLGSP